MAALAERDRTARTEALRARGVERYAAGDLEAAAALWREALALAPDDIQAQAYVAWIESRMAMEAAATGGSGATRPASSVPEAMFSAETVDPIATIPADTRLASPESTLDWYPSVPASARSGPPSVDFVGVEAPVRRFLAHTPTRPNLVPLEDVPVLSEDRLAELAGWQRPAPPVAPVAAPATAPVTAAALARAAPAGAGAVPRTLEIDGGPDPRQDTGGATMVDFEDLTDLDAVPRRVIGEPSTRKMLSSFPFAERALAARVAIDRGDLELAVTISEEVVAAAGGLDGVLIVDHVPTLSMIYERAVGRRDRLVALGFLPPDLDPRSAFVLSRVDGSFSIEDLLDISGMERSVAYRLIALLLRSGALVAS